MALKEEIGLPVASKYEKDDDINNILDHCRICGEQKSVTELWDIKSNSDFFEKYFEKLDFLNICLDFNSNLPNNTCQPCYTQLNNTYYFYKRLDSAQMRLNIIFNNRSPKQSEKSGNTTPNYDSDGVPGTSNYNPGREMRLQKIADHYNKEITAILEENASNLRCKGQPAIQTFSTQTNIPKKPKKKRPKIAKESDTSDNRSSESDQNYYETSDEIITDDEKNLRETDFTNIPMGTINQILPEIKTEGDVEEIINKTDPDEPPE